MHRVHEPHDNAEGKNSEEIPLHLPHYLHTNSTTLHKACQTKHGDGDSEMEMEMEMAIIMCCGGDVKSSHHVGTTSITEIPAFFIDTEVRDT